MSNEKQDYIPFGEEWVSYMKKHSKEVLVDLIANAYNKNIEQKDNWIKIESDNDFPKKEGSYWIYDGINVTTAFFNFGSKFQLVMGINCKATHYHPIIKPNAPTI